MGGGALLPIYTRTPIFTFHTPGKAGAVFTGADLASPPASHEALTGGAEQSRAAPERTTDAAAAAAARDSGPPFPLPQSLSQHTGGKKGQTHSFICKPDAPLERKKVPKPPGAPKTVQAGI